MKKIFISYSHKDEEWKDRVNKHLQVFQLEGKWRTWDDRQIPVGTAWEKEITDAIQSAHAAVLLISTEFLTSDFIRNKEVPLVLDRWKKNEIIVFPVIVEPCSWQAVPWLKQMQVFPKDGIPLEKMRKVKRKENLKLLAEKLNQLLWGPAGAEAGDGELELIPGSAPMPGKVKTILLTGLPKRQIKLLGREKELAELEKKLDQADRVLLVNGMGGIGKTEVCKRFFMDHYSQYSFAGWIDYLGTIKESLVNAINPNITGGSSQDSMDERFAILEEFLCHLQGNALLILDNLENPGDPGLDLFKTMPAAVKVIATSQQCIQGFEEYPLEVLPKASCRELFYRFYQGKPDDEAVNRLLELCGCHTLTVELLARTANKEKLPVGELVKLLEKKGFNLDKVICEPVGTFWHDEKVQKVFFHHLQTVFDLSKLTKKEKPVAANLSVLPSVYIPAKDVCAWLGLKTKQEINGLIDKGWLKQDEGFSLYMHPVLREVVRQKTRPVVRTCEKLIASLANKLYLEPADNPMDKKGYVIFTEEVLRHIDEKAAALATLANNLSSIYHALGQLDRALEFQLKANEVAEQVLAKNHPDLATSYNNLSLIYKDLGQLDRALEFQLKAVEIREQVLDKNHLDLATSYNNLSSIYKALGQLDRALEFQLKAVEIRAQVLDKNHPDIAQSYNNLSNIYKALGQLDRALEFQLKAVEIREQVLDKNHPNLAASYNNLSLVYQALGQLDRARPYAQKAVDIMTTLFPHGHPNLDIMRKNLEGLES
jgi:tetratricopeptide (TPR) repeat protein